MMTQRQIMEYKMLEARIQEWLELARCHNQYDLVEKYKKDLKELRRELEEEIKK